MHILPFLIRQDFFLVSQKHICNLPSGELVSNEGGRCGLDPDPCEGFCPDPVPYRGFLPDPDSCGAFAGSGSLLRLLQMSQILRTTTFSIVFTVLNNVPRVWFKYILYNVS